MKVVEITQKLFEFKISSHKGLVKFKQLLKSIDLFTFLPTSILLYDHIQVR